MYKSSPLHLGTIIGLPQALHLLDHTQRSQAAVKKTHQSIYKTVKNIR